MTRLDIAPISLDCVGHALKGEKGNARWQKDIIMPRKLPSGKRTKTPTNVFKQEVRIFEVAEHAKVGQNAKDEKEFAAALIFDSLETEADEVINQGSSQYQKPARNAPAHIEYIAGYEQEPLLRAEGAQATSKKANQGEEQDKLEGSENHKLIRVFSQLIQKSCRGNLLTVVVEVHKIEE